MTLEGGDIIWPESRREDNANVRSLVKESPKETYAVLGSGAIGASR